MEDLMKELRRKIVETLQIPGLTTEDIREDDPLVGGDLGIDSIDVLELVMMIEKTYGIRIEDKEVGEKVFASLRTLTSYILENRVRPAAV